MRLIRMFPSPCRRRPAFGQVAAKQVHRGGSEDPAGEAVLVGDLGHADGDLDERRPCECNLQLIVRLSPSMLLSRARSALSTSAAAPPFAFGVAAWPRWHRTA